MRVLAEGPVVATMQTTPVPSGATEAPVALEVRDIYKGFGGVPVLKGISLALEPGTITALAGENGAGKSTLMKIASGQYKADSGIVLARGAELPTGSTQAAAKAGVAIVPQELASLPDMTVYENIFIGRELRGPMGLRRREMIEEARRNLAEFDLTIDPSTRMGTLPVGVRQMIEIIKATNTGARAILLDEPSSAIAAREVARLVEVMRKLRDQGVALLFTTHKMEEMRELADKVVVLRDGGLVMDAPMRDVSDDDIVTAMIGRELEDLFPDVAEPADEVVLEVTKLQIEDAHNTVDLSVRRGEIVGLSGLVGAGRSELMEGIFGIRRVESGEVRIAGKKVRRNDPGASIVANVAFVPEDRKGAGGVLQMDVLDNATLPRIEQFNIAGWLRQRKRREDVGAATESVRLKSRGLNQPMETLSGGNQQKVVFARWLVGDVDVLLLDEPTRGVDVGARSEIYRIIVDLAAKGMAVLMASSDMPEILSLSHRALVMRDGGVVAELSKEELQQEDAQDRIFRYASGLLEGTATTAETQEETER